MAEASWLLLHVVVALLLAAYAAAWAGKAWSWSRFEEAEAVDRRLLVLRGAKLAGLDLRSQGWLLGLLAIVSGLLVPDAGPAAAPWLAAKLAVLVGFTSGLAFFLRRPQPAMAYFLLVAVLAMALLSLPLVS